MEISTELVAVIISKVIEYEMIPFQPERLYPACK